MKKGLVIEIEKKVAYVLNDQGAFETIKVRPGLEPGKQVYYFEEDLAPKSGGGNWKVWVAYAAVLMLAVFFGARAGMLLDGVCAVVSLDDGPSLQLYLNRDLEVLEVAVSDEAPGGQEASDLEGLSVEAALKRALTGFDSGWRDRSGGMVLIAAASVDDRVDGEALADLLAKAVSEDEWVRETDLTVFVLQAESSDVAESEARRMSLGKFRVLKLNEEKNLDPELLKAMDVRTIFEKDYLAAVEPVVQGTDWWLADEEFQQDILDQEEIPAGGPGDQGP